MPEDRSKVDRRDFNRHLPKKEAAGAVVVGTLAWLFVLMFGICYVALDIRNLVASGKLFVMGFKAFSKRTRAIINNL